MRIRWTKPAREALRRIRRYIALDNPRAAARVAHRISGATHQLARFPHMGRPGTLPGERELIVPGTPYIVGYTVTDTDVEIDEIWHRAQQPEL